ncbi:NUDIX hydrolase domain-like protein [Parachaetomium inaequale]|uniref:NUDIX hydrolase domain-like protein n=1 Tax=Parachaetomium inaequale TaxID=2588326 RepID=A0AAN6STS3_9PEZI|nr:NUDIX hydrolase domain-like protein [Parachaetomium inaequale]
MASRLTSLDLVNKCDGFPDPERDPPRYSEEMNRLYTLIWEDSEGPFPIGYVPLSVLEALQNTPESIRGPMAVDHEARTILLFQEPTTEPERTKLISQLTAHWRHSQTFRILKGWRDELWPVYGRSGELLFSIERVAMGLFGTARFGVHMTAFVRHSDDKSRYDFRIWVPRRAADKSTYPGMLDNTVAGGLMTGEDPFECVIREADEEASLPGDFMRRHAEETGTITYIYITDERAGGEPGWIYPECQWVYDLELPADGSVTPRPKDGEVESFSLRTVEEIQEQLAQGLWKPNCAMIMLDFFARHGILTPENEPHYHELRARAHRFIPFPGPHWPHWQHASPPERRS